jgi:ribulose 1,5-bisphosphate synthetase/thiazole synthase
VEVTVVAPAVVHALRTLSAQKRTSAGTEVIAATEDVVVRQNPKNVDGVPLRAQE